MVSCDPAVMSWASHLTASGLHFLTCKFVRTLEFLKFCYLLVWFCVVRNIGWDFPGGTVVKNSLTNVGAEGDLDLTAGLRRSSGGGNGYPLQHSCLENPMDRGAWPAAVQGFANSWTQLSD